MTRPEWRSRPGKLNPAYTHGLSGTSLYWAYREMCGRCYNPNKEKWHRYGGRGIAVCDEWRNDKRAFFRWSLANGYALGLTLDRINNDGNYEPGNCRWTTALRQARNTSNNVVLEFGGKKMCLPDWADETGIPITALRQRFRYGWSTERILTEPLRPHAPYKPRKQNARGSEAQA